ncbi:hypothetical protein MEO40_25320 [Dolichospermum sp. ST_sed1]|nr:hypothetical protein [Dolichospermum sp. ST_sed1]
MFDLYTESLFFKGFSVKNALISIIFLMLSTQIFAANTYRTTCLGNKNAKEKIIFLHGMAPKRASKANVGFEGLFAQLAKEKNIQIAIPYSSETCRKDSSKFCWGLERQDGVSQTYQRILESSKSCFGDAKDFALIGFSNGGYFAAKVILRGLQPEPKWVVGIGSAGRIKQLNPRSSYPDFTLVIGKSDMTHSESKSFFQDLKNRNFPVQFREFVGGHDVDKEVISSILSEKSSIKKF